MTQGSQQETKRRPYRKPEITSSTAFERLALACNGKTDARHSAKPPNTTTPCGSIGSS